MLTSTLPSMMRVPQFVGGKKIEFVERPVPEPAAGQLLIQVKANALCGSERGQFQDGAKNTPGHEAAGIVVAAGPGTRTPVGTPGVIFLMDYCTACRNCRRGSTNQCLAKRGDMGFNRDGGYGAYELIPETIFFPIDQDIPLSDATLLLDVMGTSAHALKRAQLVLPEIEALLITGAGPVGLGVLAMAKLLLGQEVPVVIADVVDFRLDLAASLGGLPIQLRATTLEDGLRSHGHVAVDLAVDTSGKQAAREGGLGVLQQRGVLVCVGHGEVLHLHVSRDLIAPERAVLGSEYFCYSEFAGNLSLLRAHLPYLRQIITHRYPVQDIQRAFELFFEGTTGKVVIEQ